MVYVKVVDKHTVNHYYSRHQNMTILKLTNGRCLIFVVSQLNVLEFFSILIGASILKGKNIFTYGALFYFKSSPFKT